MQFIMMVLLLFSGSVLLVASGLAVQEHQACYGKASARNCSQHRLQCQHGSSIFFTQAVRGFKPWSNNCPHKREDCLNIDTCCRYMAGDCTEVYTQEVFSALFAECWNNQACNFTVPDVLRDTCNTHRYYSRYSKVHYLCIPDGAILDFNDTRETTASSVALRFASAHESTYYTCLVEANDCTSLPMDLTLYRPNTVPSADFCIISPMNNGDQTFCSSEWAQLLTFQRTTPFYVKLLVSKHSDAVQAWILIYSNTSSKVRVMCKPLEDRNPFPECSSTTASSPPPETTPVTESQTDVQSSSPAVGAHPDITAESMPQSADTSSSTAGIVGGVLGVAVLLLVVALVVTVVFLKRRIPQEKKSSNVVAWFKGGNSNTKNAPTAGGTDSGRAKLHKTPAQPTSLPVYDNSAATIADEAGIRDAHSDYNHLGQKPSSSASRDVTYGHLTDGSDVTDYDYDHVTKGKPAVRSGDVINNVYNTAGPNAGDLSDEGLYNTTGGAKNRPDVINNVYSAPSPVTDAGCDVDYYNVTGVPHASRDVTKK